MKLGMFLLPGVLIVLFGSFVFNAQGQTSEEDTERAKALGAAVANSHYNVISQACANGLVTVWKDMKFGKRSNFNDADAFIIDEQKDFIVVHVAFKKYSKGGSWYKLSKKGDRIIEFGLEK